MAVRPVDPPPFDAKAANDAWLREVKKESGASYAVFENGGFQKLNRWFLGIGEYDGTGLADAVKTNAVQQNQLKEDLDAHKAADLSRHQGINQRLSALEAAVANPPFPG